MDRRRPRGPPADINATAPIAADGAARVHVRSNLPAGRVQEDRAEQDRAEDSRIRQTRRAVPDVPHAQGPADGARPAHQRRRRVRVPALSNAGVSPRRLRPNARRQGRGPPGLHARAGPRARVRARARGPNRARPGVLRRAPRGGVAGRETHPERTRNGPGYGGVRVLRGGRVRRSDAEGPEGRARRARGGEQGEGRAGGAAQAAVHGGRRHGPGAAEELGAVAVSAPFPRPRRRREVSDGARGEQEVRERGDGGATEGHCVARGRRGDRSSSRGADAPEGRSRGDLRRFQRRLHEARHRVRRRRAHRVDVGLELRSASQRVDAR